MNEWEEKRREEIIWGYSRLYNFVKHDDRLNRFADEIISQEKEMIREAFQELLNIDRGIINPALKVDINKIIQSKGIKEI